MTTVTNSLWKLMHSRSGIQGAAIPTPMVKRTLTDDTRALFKGLYDANATFVIERCGALFEPVSEETVTRSPINQED